MIFLLTNDDGYHSEKLKITKEILSKFGEVYTVAPKEEQSAKSMSLTIGGFHFDKLDEYNYLIEGTPVDCVSFACFGIGLKPDLVVSGTNHGYNIGIDTRYSGTVGACLQAQYFGFPSLALSADNRGNTILKNELEHLLDYIISNKLYSNEFTLNVNFPRDQFIQSKGIKHTKLNHVIYGFNPEIKDSKFIPRRKYITESAAVEGTDTWAYIKGYTSISKISL